MKFLNILSLIFCAFLLESSIIATPSTRPLAKNIQQAPSLTLSSKAQQKNTEQESDEISLNDLKEAAKSFAFEALIPGLIRQNSYACMAYYPYLCWRHGVREATELFIIDSMKSISSILTGRKNLLGGSMTGLSGFLTRLTTSIFVDCTLRAYLATPFTNRFWGVKPTQAAKNQPSRA